MPSPPAMLSRVAAFDALTGGAVFSLTDHRVRETSLESSLSTPRVEGAGRTSPVDRLLELSLTPLVPGAASGAADGAAEAREVMSVAVTDSSGRHTPASFADYRPSPLPNATPLPLMTRRRAARDDNIPSAPDSVIAPHCEGLQLSYRSRSRRTTRDSEVTAGAGGGPSLPGMPEASWASTAYEDGEPEETSAPDRTGGSTGGGGSLGRRRRRALYDLNEEMASPSSEAAGFPHLHATCDTPSFMTCLTDLDPYITASPAVRHPHLGSRSHFRSDVGSARPAAGETSPPSWATLWASYASSRSGTSITATPIATPKSQSPWRLPEEVVEEPFVPHVFAKGNGFPRELKGDNMSGVMVAAGGIPGGPPPSGGQTSDTASSMAKDATSALRASSSSISFPEPAAVTGAAGIDLSQVTPQWPPRVSSRCTGPEPTALPPCNPDGMLALRGPQGTHPEGTAENTVGEDEAGSGDESDGGDDGEGEHDGEAAAWSDDDAVFHLEEEIECGLGSGAVDELLPLSPLGSPAPPFREKADLPTSPLGTMTGLGDLGDVKEAAELEVPSTSRVATAAVARAMARVNHLARENAVRVLDH